MAYAVETGVLMICIVRCERVERVLFGLALVTLGGLIAAGLGGLVITPEALETWSTFALACTASMVFFVFSGLLLLRRIARLRARLQHLRFLQEDEMMRHGRLEDRAAH